MLHITKAAHHSLISVRLIVLYLLSLTLTVQEISLLHNIIAEGITVIWGGGGRGEGGTKENLRTDAELTKGG